ncbi:unnamed protein product [Umbelopsis sp. WA50703]
MESNELLKPTEDEHIFSSLSSAAITLEAQPTNELKAPDVADILQGSSSGQYEIVNSKSRQTFRIKEQYKLPDDLLKELEVLKATNDSVIGLFTEIGRSWCVVQSKLYLWKYVDGSDLQVYEDVTGPIISVILAPTKPGVFLPEVSHVLVVATAKQIATIGISVDTKSGSLSFFETDMCVPSDNIRMTRLCATKAGRIFMAGEDGYLYEFDYKPQESWFARRCRKVCHPPSKLSYFLSLYDDPVVDLAVDESRNMLYQLTAMHNLRVAYLGQDGKQLTNVAQCTNIRKKAQSLSHNSKLFDEPKFDIISIHAINSSESQKARLIAVTAHGARLYFTSTKASSAEPSSIQLTHVRLPVQQTPTSEPPTIDAAFYMDGIFMTADKEKPKIACICPDAAFMNGQRVERGNTIEAFEEFSVPGKVCLITEEHQSIPIQMKLNELTASSTIPPRRFLVQTRTGLTVVEKRRPIEMLQQLIAESGSCFDTKAKDLREFIEHYGAVQTYAMCFDLVCKQSPQDKEATPESLTTLISTQPAARLFYSIDSPSVIGSLHGKNGASQRDGFALYLYRLLHPLWKQKVTVTNKQPSNSQNSSIPKPILLDVQAKLCQLKLFMDLNPYINPKPLNPNDIQTSMEELYQLLVHAIEAVAFISYLIDVGFPSIVERMPVSAQVALMGLTYESMLTKPDGRTVLRHLVTSLVDIQLQKGTELEVVTDMLQNCCGTLTNPKEVIMYKAVQQVRKVADGIDASQRSQQLGESLRLFKKIADYLSYEQLEEICEEYKNLNYHIGVVDLALTCAQAKDPYDRCSSYVEDGCPPMDSRKKYYDIKKRCYICVFSALLDAEYAGELQFEPTDSTAGGKPNNNSIYHMILSSQDRAFHFELYEWFISKGMIRQLLTASTPYVVPFLKRPPFRKENYDLLWEHYRLLQQYDNAAQCLEQLALYEGEMPLEKRIEYLSLAISCAKSYQGPRIIQMMDMVRRLEQDLEIANEQLLKDFNDSKQFTAMDQAA